MVADFPTLPDFDSLWNFDAPETSEAAFRAVLPVAKSSGDRDYLAQLLTQIARSEGLVGHAASMDARIAKDGA